MSVIGFRYDRGKETTAPCSQVCAEAGGEWKAIHLPCRFEGSFNDMHFVKPAFRNPGYMLNGQAM